MWRVHLAQVGYRQKFQLINWTLWFSGRKGSLWCYMVKYSLSFICFRWLGSRHRSVLILRGIRMQRPVWITSLLRTHLGSQKYTTAIRASWKVAFTWLHLLSLRCDLIALNHNCRWPLSWHVPSPRGASMRNAGGEGTSEVPGWSSTGRTWLFAFWLSQGTWTGSPMGPCLFLFPMCPLATIWKEGRKSKQRKIWLTYMCSRLKNSNYLMRKMYFMKLREWKHLLGYCMHICIFYFW